MYLKSVFLLFWSCYLWTKVFCQNQYFDFYGNDIELYNASAFDIDSIINKDKVPTALREYLDKKIAFYELEDWAIVLFLKKFVAAEFAKKSESFKVKFLSTLLTSQNINNAIGAGSRNRILSLLCIDKNILPEGIAVFDEYGSKFIYKAGTDVPFRLREIDLVYYKGNDILLRAKPPNLKATDEVTLTRFFYNYSTHQTDSIRFKYSPTYITYSRDFPLALSRVNYLQLPISSAFTNSFFAALSPKLMLCKTREDSINFLMRLTQTVLKYKESGTLHTPEQTLLSGTGDCTDESLFLAFLLSYYFPDVDVVFLSYDWINHVRLGIYDKNIDSKDKSFIEYKGKKYLLAELTAESVLGDVVFKDVQRYPSRIIE